MSEKLSNKVKEDSGEYKVPEKVWNANWHDDVEETNVINFEDFEFFKDEERYQNDPSDDREGVNAKIKNFQKRGAKILRLMALEEEMRKVA